MNNLQSPPPIAEVTELYDGSKDMLTAARAKLELASAAQTFRAAIYRVDIQAIVVDGEHYVKLADWHKFLDSLHEIAVPILKPLVDQYRVWDQIWSHSHSDTDVASS